MYKKHLNTFLLNPNNYANNPTPEFFSRNTRRSINQCIIFSAQSVLQAQTPEIPVSLSGFTADVIADPVLNPTPDTLTTKQNRLGGR